MDGDSVRFFVLVPIFIAIPVLMIVYNGFDWIDLVLICANACFIAYFTRNFLEVHRQYYADGHYEYIFHIFRKPKYVPLEELEDGGNVDEQELPAM